jgi:hypothetical protein
MEKPFKLKTIVKLHNMEKISYKMVNKYTCISSWTNPLLLASGYGQSRSPLPSA